MGYESKIYIVEKGHKFKGETHRFCSVIAMFDLGKFYDVSDFMRHCPVTDCYFYADDRNTQVLEDGYNDSLTETTIDKMVEVLEKAKAKGNYRRVSPLLFTLYAMQKDKDKWRDLAVLHYGY